jgi:hypothetical protein
MKNSGRKQWEAGLAFARGDVAPGDLSRRVLQAICQRREAAVLLEFLQSLAGGGALPWRAHGAAHAINAVFAA